MNRRLRPLDAVRQYRGGFLRNLPRRARLTLQYLGFRAFLWRIVTFPLRLTPLGARLGYGVQFGEEFARARRWYRSQGRFVTVVIPTFGPSDLTFAAVKSIRRTVNMRKARILVVDDGSAPEDQRRLGDLKGAEVILGEKTLGFAANVNRGLKEASEGDVVLLNNDTIAERGWLEGLQYAAYRGGDSGIVGPKLLYGDGRIQSAGSLRNPGAPEWFDHRFRFKPAHHGPANVPTAVLGVTGACMYIRRDAFDQLGLLDESFPMAYEDMDYCLRAWEAGFSVVYYPHATLTHLESQTRSRDQGESELASQRHFWHKWSRLFDTRPVRTSDGKLRIIYITQDTGMGGGHRVIFEHVDGLLARGHDVTIYSLDEPPDWFSLQTPVKTFSSYTHLAKELASQDAIKVATWWNTAETVWRASVLRGIPVYFVQDIETSYYPDDPSIRDRVLVSYRPEFHYLTTSPWNRDQLHDLGFEATIVAPGLDHKTFHPLGLERHEDVVLTVGRTHHLKNLNLTIEAWESLRAPPPELWMFGIEPELGAKHGARYFESPSDKEVNELLNKATIFVQTSRHEGFCLPLLEAMAAGTPTVCTDAHGNRSFCKDGVNCLMVEDHPSAVARAIDRLRADPELRERLGTEGLATAQEHHWAAKLDELEEFFEHVAGAGLPIGVAAASAPAA